MAHNVWNLHFKFAQDRTETVAGMEELPFASILALNTVDNPSQMMVRRGRIYLPMRNVIGINMTRAGGICGGCLGHGTVPNDIPPGSSHFLSERTRVCEMCGGTGLESEKDW